jgi:hypothetical protein
VKKRPDQSFLPPVHSKENAMSIYDEIKNELNQVLTENRDVAFHSSGSKVYDFFATVGAMRFQHAKIINRFLLSFAEDRQATIKLLFYVRDIIDGMGERDSFRAILSFISRSMPDIALQMIPHLKDYGRFDDYLVLLDSPLAQSVADYFWHLLNDPQDQNNTKLLLAKWLPSINASNPQTREYARLLASAWHLSYKDYRQTLSRLRKGVVLETYLCRNDFSFNYQTVPGQAMMRYSSLFWKKDKERFFAFNRNVNNGTATFNTKTISANQITARINISEEKIDEEVQLVNRTMNSMFADLTKKYPDIDQNTIVVRDGSGSMTTRTNGIIPLDIANALTILFAEKIQGPLHNSFITFSQIARFVTFKEEWNTQEKLQFLEQFDDCSNTNIENVFNLLLSLVANEKISKDEMIKRVIIISDMEFDASAFGGRNLDIFIERFAKLGLEMPSLIFWCVDNRHNTVPVIKQDHNCLAIGGYSQNLLKPILGNIELDYLSILDSILAKYEFVNDFDL